MCASHKGPSRPGYAVSIVLRAVANELRSPNRRSAAECSPARQARFSRARKPHLENTALAGFRLERNTTPPLSPDSGAVLLSDDLSY